MQISNIVPSFNPLPAVAGHASPAANRIGEQATRFLSQVNELQVNADRMAGQMAVGDARSLHAVMIASEEAGLALSAALTVRNKAVEAYQEIMRMQV